MNVPDFLRVKYKDITGLYDSLMESDKIDVVENGPNPEQDRYYLTSKDIILKRPAHTDLDKMYKYGPDDKGFAVWWLEKEAKEISDGNSPLGRVIWMPEKLIREYRLRDINRFRDQTGFIIYRPFIELCEGLDKESRLSFDSIVEKALLEYKAYHESFPALLPAQPPKTLDDKLQICFRQGMIEHYCRRIRGKYFAFWGYDDFIRGNSCVLLHILMSMATEPLYGERGVFCLFVDQGRFEGDYFEKTKMIVSDLRSKAKSLSMLFPQYRIRIYHVVFCGGEYRFWNERTERFYDTETGEIWERKLFVYELRDHHCQWVQGEPKVIRPITGRYEEEIGEDKAFLKPFDERSYFHYKGMTLLMMHMSFYKLDEENRLWSYYHIYEWMFIDNNNDFVEIEPEPEWEDYEII